MRTFRNTAQAVTAFLLAVLLAIAPVVSAAVDNNNMDEQAEQAERGFLQAIGGTYDHMKGDILELIPVFQTRGLINLFGFRPRDKDPTTGELVRDELTEALQALNNFNASVLKDDKLAEALDEIIWELLEEEDFTAGIQDKKRFISSIIRDERLVEILGDVIADYLKDERLAEDIELFFSIILDLIADDNLQDFFKETIARLIEDSRTANLLNGIMQAVAHIVYETSTDAVADLTADNRIKEIIKDLTAIFMEPAPDMVANLIEDERMQAVSQEMAVILLQYGPDMTADLFEDARFRSLLSDMIILTVDMVTQSITGTMRDPRLGGLIEGAFGTAADVVAEGTLSNIARTMVDDFFKCDEFRAFVDPSFLYIIEESKLRAEENTVGDSLELPGFDVQLNLTREMAWGIAEVPPELAYLGFFNWLVYGEPHLNAGTYGEWAEDVGDLITPDFVTSMGSALAGLANDTIPRLIDENKEIFFEDFQDIFETLPFDETARFIRGDKTMGEFPKKLAEIIFSHIPFDFVAQSVREDTDTIDTLTEVTGEFIDRFPLREVGEFVQEDQRIPSIISDSIPDLPLEDIARLIREDNRITDLITEIANDFPVAPISRFLQGEMRADIIGHTVSSLLLNLVADFIESERLTGFIYNVLVDIMESFDEPVAKILLDSLAKFYENDEVAPFLAGSLVGLVGEAKPELHNIYKQVVPKFFTRLIFGGG